MLGDHTFFLDKNGLNVVEPNENNEVDASAGTVTNQLGRCAIDHLTQELPKSSSEWPGLFLYYPKRAVLKQSGDDLTRENVMKQAANLENLAPSMILPGITISTGPNDYAPIKQMQMMRFNGASWELFGPVMTGEVGG